MSVELDLKYLEYLQEVDAPSKIPYIKCVPANFTFSIEAMSPWYNSSFFAYQ